MARPQTQRHDASARQLLLLLLLRLLLLLPSATAASFSKLCRSAAPRDLPIDRHRHYHSADFALPSSITAGHFTGGRDLLFARDRPYTHALTFYPRGISARATSEPGVTHLSATLTLEGTRARRGWRDDDGAGRPHSVSFDLDGYYNSSTATSASTSTAELCMVGSGSYATEDGSGVVVLSDVVLRLHLPQPSNLSRPFVTGTVKGAHFRSIALLAYAEDDYAYGDRQAASCPPPPPVPVRQVLQAWPPYYSSCHRLSALLRSSYSLEYRPTSDHDGASSSSFPLRLRRHGSMHVNQMRCAADGAVRAYMVFYTNQSDASPPPSNYTALHRSTFVIGDEALVADGFWDLQRDMLCLRACRVVASSGSDLRVRECGIGVGFWFPGVWSIRDRSIATGMIWNTTGNWDSGGAGGVISVSRTAGSYYRGDLAGISYNYTRVEEAKKHYDDSIPALRSKERKGGRFPGNYSYRDFTFQFFLEKQGLQPGYARPVTIGSALVEGDELMADAAFSQHVAAAEANEQRLWNVSYSLEYQVVASGNLSLSAKNVSPAPLEEVSVSPRLQLQRISAEGVYDIKTGFLCLVACKYQVTNNGSSSSSSSDCDVLVTFQFAPVDSVEGERGVGTIRSLRRRGDPLFFEAMDLVSYGMTVQQVEQSSSRMDMESVMLVVSMTLSCVFTALQLRHASRHPEALPATSVTMLVVLALGYVIPLVLNLEDMYNADTRRRRYVLQMTTAGSLDLNEFMLRVSTMLALVLQLRLLQLALSSRRSTTDHQAGSKQQDSSSSSAAAAADAERSTLWICLPLYALGAAVVWIVHMSDGHHLQVHGPRGASAFSGVSAPPPSGPALVDDLAAYAGLILDGFLLPQVVSNALSGSRVPALSPWFYAGGTAIRAAPHAYDVFRKRSYVLPGWNRKPATYTYVYASHRDDLFGAAWDVAILCGAALLAALLFLQQRLGGDFLCCLKSGRPGSGEYEMVSTTTISS